MLRSSSGKKPVLLCAVLLIITVLLCAFFVNTHDDYYVPDSGLSFQGSVTFALEMGNGRYIGNVLGNYLPTRYVPNLLVRSFFIYCTFLLFPAVFLDFDRRSILISLPFLLFPGCLIYGETYQWAHGFYNYLPPVTMLLAGMCVVRYTKADASRARRVLVSAGLFLLGAVQCLFSENSTVICILAAVYMLVVSLLKSPQRRTYSAAFLIGAVLGALIMFVGPSALGVADKMDWYRQTADFSSLKDILVVAAINGITIAQNLAHWHFIWLTLIAVFIVRQRKLRKKGASLLIAVLLLAVPVMTYIGLFVPLFYYLCPPTISALLFAGISVAAALVLILILFSADSIKKISFSFFCAAVSLGGLFIVRPIGARLMFLPYIFMTDVTIRLLLETLDRFAPAASVKITRLYAGAAAALCFWLLASQIRIFSVNRLRVRYMDAQFSRGQEEIFVIDLPHDYLLHFPNGSEMYRYAYNYGDMEAMSFPRAVPEDIPPEAFG